MKAHWTKPCPNCGRACDKLARWCRTCSNLIRRTTTLERHAPPRMQRVLRGFELYCLLCGRGVGERGQLVVSAQLPSRRVPCAHCGGVLFVREVGDVLIPVPNAHTTHHVRKVA